MITKLNSMKTFLYLLPGLLLLPGLMNAQQPRARLRLENTQLMQPITTFTVNSETPQARDTATRVEQISKFRLKPGETKAVAKTGNSISKVDKALLPTQFATGESVFLLPELYYSRESLTGLQLAYRILIVDAAPLRFNFARNIFEGSIRFIPVEVTNGSTSQPGKRQLASPEEILVSYGNTSTPLKIQSINWPPLEVPIQSADVMDSMEVKIITMGNPLGYPEKLGVEPAIVISSARTKMQGMGIQTIPVHVSLKGVSGNTPVPVGIETSLGGLDTAGVLLRGQVAGVVNLRSESVGDVVIKAVHPNYRSNTLELKAVFPWLFLLLALLGGMIGALGKSLVGKKKIRFRPLALGSILGLIVAVAYWGLGIVLIGFSIESRGFNEAMVLGLGLLAGYFGMSVGNPSGAKA